MASLKSQSTRSGARRPLARSPERAPEPVRRVEPTGYGSGSLVPAPVCRAVLAAGVLALGAGGCASSGLERLPSLGVAELAEGVQVARMRVDSYYFEPSRLMVQAGVPVRLVLENGTLLTGHDFSVFAPDANLEIDAYVPARQQVTVQFLPQKVGEYRFYCNIDDHADRGEVGTLVVVEELDGAR